MHRVRPVRTSRRADASQHPFTLSKIVLLNDPRWIARDDRIRRNAAPNHGVRSHYRVPSDSQFALFADNHRSETNPTLFFDSDGPVPWLLVLTCSIVNLLQLRGMIHH